MLEQLREMQNTWTVFMCLRIAIDISKPFRMSINIRKADGSETKVPISYERLPEYYYFYGIIGHSDNQCETLIDI